MARLTGFVRRRLRKLDLHGFLLSCMILALQQHCSLRQQAILAGIGSGSVISKQALHKKMGAKAAAFLQACLGLAISARLAGHSTGIRSASFARILVQDSTCVSLSPRLAARFPGPSNQTGKVQSCLRIQCLYDVLTERFVWFYLSAFIRNDQAAAADVLALLKPNDLLMRDLGYFTLRPLKAITATGAFFVSRLRYGLTLFDGEPNEPLDLRALLRPGILVDLPVRLGQKDKIAVRLLAFPVPAHVAAQRRRKARANRDKRLNHSELYMFLLGWNIFVTNAAAPQLPASMVSKLYRLRWRIEIIFKAWKSHLGLTRIGHLGDRQLEALIYGLLLFVVLTQSPDRLEAVPRSVTVIPCSHPSNLSLLRLSDIFGQWLIPLLFSFLSPDELLQRFLAQLHSHARYDRRRRKNYSQFHADALG